MNLPKLSDEATDLKKPRSWWDTIITSTPVVMTVLATILAGLSSSEMSQSQYYRSLSAQNQSKAGDQWGFFQAKKGRGAADGNTAELMQNIGDVAPLTAESFASAAAHLAMRMDSTGAAVSSGRAMDVRGRVEARLADADVREGLALLGGAELPAMPELKIGDAQVRRAFDAVRRREDETVQPAVFAAVKEPALREALQQADQNAMAADEAMKPAMRGIDKLQDLLRELAGAGTAAAAAATTTRAATRAASQAVHEAAAAPPARSASDRGVPVEIRQLATDFAAARLRLEANRQERDAKLNQQVAYLYEVAVRKSSWDSERHRVRSRYFFFGMLGAQAAVTIASLSLAVREKSWLWSVATTIGVLALLSAGYVYLFT